VPGIALATVSPEGRACQNRRARGSAGPNAAGKGRTTPNQGSNKEPAEGSRETTDRISGGGKREEDGNAE